MEYQEAREICLKVIEGKRWFVLVDIQDAVMALMNEISDLKRELNTAYLAHDVSSDMLVQSKEDVVATNLALKSADENNECAQRKLVYVRSAIADLKKVTDNA